MKHISNSNSAKLLKRRSQSGQALAFVAFGLATFIAAAGLAIDLGYLRYEKRLMQSAADSAAMAAATDFNLGNATQYNTDALDAAQSNGFQNGVNNTTVTVTNPPTVLTVADPNAVQVSIQRIVPTSFMSVLGVANNTIGTTAVATVAPSDGCLYALGAAGITLGGGVNSPNCGIVDNGILTGAGNITASSVGVLGSTGGYGGVSTPAPESITQAASNPLAYVMPPAIPACNAFPNFAWMAGTITLTEGNYCGGITITGGTVTFNPGLYFLTGAVGLRISGTGAATGTNVTFYNTGTGAITFTGTGAISLTAPTPADVAGDGTFGSVPGGLVLYQDPANTAAADVSQAGSGNVVLNGALYFPTASVTVAGSLNPGSNTLVVASSITVSAGTALDSDSTGLTTTLPSGSPLKSVSLVE